jgi:hypothetical protein
VLLDQTLIGRVVKDPNTSTLILRKDLFRAYAAGDSLDSVVPRNAFVGDGLNTLDLGLYKTFRVAGRATLAVRMEAFNVFNTVQYGFPDANFSNTTFGQLTAVHSSYIPRTLQLTMRLSY